jgi:DNA (cytosine-5)-methyltransferase 1
MKYFVTFTGIGGFTKAIQDITPDAECVGYSEIDKYATQIYAKHYPEHTNYGDIRNIDTDKLPDFDLLVGGFPCQTFSVAGKRAGFSDTRGTLFFELARFLKNKRPRHFIFENVKGLLSHDGGKTLQVIFGVLTDLGYEYQWQVLNSKDHGVPQSRERVYIIGHLRGECRPEVFPITRNAETTLNYVGGILSKQNMMLLKDGKHKSRNFSQGNRVYSSTGLSTTLASQAGGLGAKTGLYFIDLSMKEAKLTETARTIQARYYKGYSTRKGETSGVTDGKRIRRLTPTECEKLQGFPVGWTEYGLSESISDTQRYKCIGNAVTVNVVKAIISKL